MLTEKLIRDAKFHAGLADVEDAQGPDPGVQHLRRELAVQGTEELFVQIVAHGGPSYGIELRTHLSTAVDNFGSPAVVACRTRLPARAGGSLRARASAARAPVPDRAAHHSTGILRAATAPRPRAGRVRRLTRSRAHL